MADNGLGLRGGAGIGNGPPPPEEKAKEVWQAIGALDSCQGCLADQIKELERRLHAVLSPEEYLADNPIATESRFKSGLAQRVEVVLGEVVTTSDRVRSILARLEV